jgi:hypothetical protein
MSISYGDKTVATLRTLVSAIESEFASAAPAEALRVAWTQVVEILALGPPPELRACPTCGNSGMRAATRCLHCWSALPLLPPSDIPVATAP